MLMEGAIGLAGSVLGALSSWLVIVRTLRAPVDALKEKVSRLEQEKIRNLEKSLEEHVREDKSQRMLAILEGIQGAMSGMSAKIDRLCEESARQAAHIEDNRQYIHNLDASFERHRQGHK